MVTTVEHLMQCGFRVIYGYTQSDEISLLFHRDETAFDANSVNTTLSWLGKPAQNSPAPR